jgi:hypothetical protein
VLNLIISLKLPSSVSEIKYDESPVLYIVSFGFTVLVIKTLIGSWLLYTQLTTNSLALDGNETFISLVHDHRNILMMVI